MSSPSSAALGLLMPNPPGARAPRAEAGGGGDFSAWLNAGEAAAPPTNALPRTPGGEVTEAPRAEAPQLPPRKRTLPPERAPERKPERAPQSALERARTPLPQTLPPELEKEPPSDPMPPTAEDQGEDLAARFVDPPASSALPPGAPTSLMHDLAQSIVLEGAAAAVAPSAMSGESQGLQAVHGMDGSSASDPHAPARFGDSKKAQAGSRTLSEASTLVSAATAADGPGAAHPGPSEPLLEAPTRSASTPAGAAATKYGTAGLAGLAANAEVAGTQRPSAAQKTVASPLTASTGLPEPERSARTASLPVADSSPRPSPKPASDQALRTGAGEASANVTPLPSSINTTAELRTEALLPQSAPPPVSPLSFGLPSTAAAPAEQSLRAQATLGMALQDPDFAAALGSQLAIWTRDGVQSAELQLNPAELGPVQVRIQLDGSLAQVQFGAEQAQTREVLQQAMEQLATALEAEGLQLQGSQVQAQLADARDNPRDAQRGAESDGRHGSAQGRSQRPNGGPEHGWQPPSTAPLAARRGLLDLYA